ncbi:ABC transporter ATP-binding protein [Propionivibrio limicola]|uniref:ABC transporter ATP-binding protein n=1 Tax=Propionivibrio limicola TaxID=167645 RepID=UPI0012928366|nr:ABC transporter ATP-binding protein [Propionivibrio limicola]
MGTIRVNNLGKAYKNYPTPKSRLLEWLVPGSKPRHSTTWILQDINFEIAAGEAVGILGINGAGKSTLLKMICGTTQPTTGSVQLQGRVAAMLELGMGFHPDFTGRQNVYMAGQLLGMQEAEITRLMPEIEGFAEIGTYIDQSVRVYSSGMQVRLAFSIATAIRPDILIIDEALSVGDAYFQHKSFNRIREYRQAGTTLLIVSHDKAAIQSICDRAILLNAGRLAMQGSPEAVADYYNALIAERENYNVQQDEGTDGKIQTISGTGEATVTDIVLKNDKGHVVELIDVAQPVTLEIRVHANTDLPRLVLGFMIKDRLGQPVFGTNTHYVEQPLHDVRAGQDICYAISFEANFGEGSYSVSTALVSTENHLQNNYEWRDLALVFNVTNISKPRFVGTSWIPVKFEIIENPASTNKAPDRRSVDADPLSQ